MKYLVSVIVVICGVLAVQSHARASSSEEKRACVEASTLGQTARDEGRLREARGYLLTCARDACPQVVRKSCGTWLSELDQRTPSVLVRVLDDDDDDVTDAEVTIDGTPALLDGRPIALDPGPHAVTASAPDGTTASRKFLLAESEKSRVLAVRLRSVRASARSPTHTDALTTLPPATAAPASPRRFRPPLGALILGGVGLASLGTATGFGVAATVERRELARTCGRGSGGEGCSDLQMQAARKNARIADYALVMGAGITAFAAAWTAYVWSREPARERPAVALVPMRDGALASFAKRF